MAGLMVGGVTYTYRAKALTGRTRQTMPRVVARPAQSIPKNWRSRLLVSVQGRLIALILGSGGGDGVLKVSNKFPGVYVQRVLCCIFLRVSEAPLYIVCSPLSDAALLIKTVAGKNWW